MINLKTLKVHDIVGGDGDNLLFLRIYFDIYRKLNNAFIDQFAIQSQGPLTRLCYVGNQFPIIN
jgi:hypothetical protein